LNRKQKFLVALDAGSAKTCALAAEVTPSGKLRCIALGRAESKGWRKGLIVNLDAVVASIRKAVEEAEQTLGAPVESAVVGLGASQIKGLNSRGGITISSRQREIQRDDVRKALEVARTISLPGDFDVVHVVPQEFLLDSQDGIRDPVGMVGSRLEVNVHVVTAAKGALTNLITAVNRAGLEVEDTVLEPMAAAEACLNSDERELGVVLLDIGSGSTDAVVFEHGALRHSFSIPIGGDHFTNDVAVGLRTPVADAETIKRSFGVATKLLVGDNTFVEVPSVGDRPSVQKPQRLLAEIIEPRAQELLERVRDELRRTGLMKIGAGAVLTGGGARLTGLCDVAEQVLDAPARIGLPVRLEGVSADTLQQPAYASLVGLLFFAQRVRQRREVQQAGFGSKVKAFFSGR
jgi:cell division protein FtsA